MCIWNQYFICVYICFHNLPRIQFLLPEVPCTTTYLSCSGSIMKTWQRFIRDFELSHNLKILHVSYSMRLCHTNLKWILLFTNTRVMVLKELCLLIMTLGFNSTVHGWGPHQYETIMYVANQSHWLDSKHYEFVEIKILQVHMLNNMTQLFINMIQSYWLKYLVILLIQYLNPIFV